MEPLLPRMLGLLPWRGMQRSGPPTVPGTVGMGAAFTDGTLGMDQVTGAGIGASASQNGNMAAIYGTTWGNATSGIEPVLDDIEPPWHRCSDTQQQQRICRIRWHNRIPEYWDCCRGRECNGRVHRRYQVPVEMGAAFINGMLSSMNQVTNADTGASASQSGIITATLKGTAKTWGLAMAANNQSQTTANAASTNLVSGIITIDANDVFAGTDGTAASQSVRISAPSGSASASSMSGANTVEIGANFSNVGSLSISQQTNATSNTNANQSGTVTGVNGQIWGNAQASDGDMSYTTAAFTAGTLTINNNGVYAGNSRINASQDLSISGGIGSSASAESGSINSVNGNYAKVSASYPTSLKSATSSLIVTQSTDNDAAVVGCATAQQNAQITAYNNLALNAMTHTEAGNASGSKAYVDTSAKSGFKLLSGGIQSVTINSNSNAVGGLDNLTAYEHKQASGTSGSWQTTATAKDAAGTISTPSTDPKTNALAWVNLISKGRSITTF